MARFGLPHTIVSDNGTQFTSSEFKMFCASNGISHVTSPAYHPASNGQAESSVKVVKKGIKSCILSNSNVKGINNKLLKYLFDYRNSVHSSTGCSPAQLVFGQKLRSRLDLIKPNSPLPASVTLTRNVDKKQCLQSKGSDEKATKYFKAGDYVLYKKNTISKKGTWQKGVIIKKIGKVIYIVRDCLTSCSVKKHKNQLLAYKGTARIISGSGDCPIEFEDITPQGTSPPNPTPLADDNTSDTIGEGNTEREEIVDTEKETSNTLEEEEFYEATESHSEDDVASGSGQMPQPERLTYDGKQLRPIPRVDYKRFY